MSVVKITPDLIENYEIVTHPKRSFQSGSTGQGIGSSTGGVTGSISLVPAPSKAIRTLFEAIPVYYDEGGGLSHTALDAIGDDVRSGLFDGEDADAGGDIHSIIEDYMYYIGGNDGGSGDEGFDSSGTPQARTITLRDVRSFQPAKYKKEFNISRTEPRFSLSDHSGSILKIHTAYDFLSQKNRQTFSHPDLAYHNYHSLNFFTASSIDSRAALLYPNFTASIPVSRPRSEFSKFKFTRPATGVRGPGDHNISGKAPYTTSGSFTFEFWINPKYTVEKPGDDFTAGTICHLSSTYAISLVTGSRRDKAGLKDGYRIMLQLSHSAEISPSKIVLTSSSEFAHNRDHNHAYVFLSSDNTLTRNRWHHVAVRWGKDHNGGSGSFVIDGNVDNYFHIPSASIAPGIITARSSSDFMPNGSYPGRVEYPPGDRDSLCTYRAGSYRPFEKFNGDQRCDPDILCIGNFYEGRNMHAGGNDDRLLKFFNNAITGTEGLSTYQPRKNSLGSGATVQRFATNDDDLGADGKSDPVSFNFQHPLNAEIHDLRIYDIYRDRETIISSSSAGPQTLENLLFYLGPFFIKEPRHSKRLRSITRGGMVTTGSTTPFEAPLAYQAGGLSISLENFTREMVNGFYPRLYFMTGAYIRSSAVESDKDATENLYRDKLNCRRNLTILPCDNGQFVPNFDLLMSGTMTIGDGQDYFSPDSGHPMSRFVDDKNVLELSQISLRNMVDQNYHIPDPISFSGMTSSWWSAFGPAKIPVPNDYHENFWSAMDYLTMYNFDHEDTDDMYKRWLPIFMQTGIDHSNQISLFEIPQMFYGQRIMPGTVKIYDHNLTGSNNRISMTLRDDGRGSLYRDDSKTEIAKWNSVGNIFYSEGLIAIKSPHVSKFGKDGFSIEFKGEQSVHVMTINAPCASLNVNRSFNPTFESMSPTANTNDLANEFVYITGIDVQDENLNVVMRSKLAQPVLKRYTDELMFRIKLDF